MVKKCISISFLICLDHADYQIYPVFRMVSLNFHVVLKMLIEVVLYL